MHFLDSLRFGTPQLGIPHPAAQRLSPHLHAVLLGQILGCQRRSKSLVHFLAQDLDRSLLHFHRKLSVRWPPAPGVNYRLVATLLQAPQHASRLPLADTDFGGRLLLRDQFLLGFLQRDQPVALPLRHLELVRFQLPSLKLSIGHSYSARIGHYNLAATASCCS